MAVREGVIPADAGLWKEAKAKFIEPLIAACQSNRGSHPSKFGASLPQRMGLQLAMAVREGFEPSVPFWSTAL